MDEAYLVDTQIVIWSIISPSKISPDVQLRLREHPILVSEISLLEIAIKQKVGRLPDLTLSVDDMTSQILADGFQLLPIDRNHISAYEKIPLFADHRDPFDRLLLATALSENLTIISADEKFLLYKDVIRLVAM